MGEGHSEPPSPALDRVGCTYRRYSRNETGETLCHPGGCSPDLQALILPYFDYCSVVWDGLSNHLGDKVQKLQNRAARVILRANYDTISSRLRNRLH